MFEWTIFGVGLFTSMLLGAGLFFTAWEFRDIAKHPERHEPHNQQNRKRAAVVPRPYSLNGYSKT